jgi:hypothetical protein
MLNNELSTAGCIFALKQLGWRDSFEQTIKSEMMKPEDANADLERLAHNLERLCVRTHQQAGIGSKPQAEAASKPGKH